MSLILIDNFDSFTYNLVQQIGALTNTPLSVFRNDEISINDVIEARPSGIIFSPGPGHPKNKSDVGVCQDILERYEELECPILGVCLGHQLIVHHFGGTVIKAPVVTHGKINPVTITKQTCLTTGLPKTFDVMRYHSLIADKTTLPDCLETILELDEPTLIMGISHKTQPIMGVQFHPESIGTPLGNNLIQNFLKITKHT